MSQRIVVDLSIPAADYLQYYSGQVKFVVARSIDGRNVRFPASVLQQVVAHDGVQGRFAIEFSGGRAFSRYYPSLIPAFLPSVAYIFAVGRLQLRGADI